MKIVQVQLALLVSKQQFGGRRIEHQKVYLAVVCNGSDVDTSIQILDDYGVQVQ